MSNFKVKSNSGGIKPEFYPKYRQLVDKIVLSGGMTELKEMQDLFGVLTHDEYRIAVPLCAIFKRIQLTLGNTRLTEKFKGKVFAIDDLFNEFLRTSGLGVTETVFQAGDRLYYEEYDLNALKLISSMGAREMESVLIQQMDRLIEEGRYRQQQDY